MNYTNSRRRLVLEGEPLCVPLQDAVLQVQHFWEALPGEDFERLRGAPAGAAVDQVGLAPVEPGHLSLEVRRLEINVDRARQAPGLEFFRSADVQDCEIRATPVALDQVAGGLVVSCG